MPAPRLYHSEFVLSLCGYTPQHLARLEKAGLFPKRFKVSAGGGKFGRVAWIADEVDAWLAERAASRNAA